MQKRRVKARYHTIPLGEVSRTITKCHIDEETKSLVQEPATVTEKMFMVKFPQGHSIRVNDAQLRALGYHIKPRLVDMDTGDLVDAGGDPYDFGDMTEEPELESEEDDAPATQTRRKG